VLTDEQAVLAANLAFYEAFAGQDVDAMDELWSRRAEVACIHPGWPPLYGREPVLQSWRSILGGSSPPAIRCGDARAAVLGEVAFVVCVEQVGGSRLVATNIFALEDGLWRMVHHQAGPFAAMPVPAVPKESLN
jgi:hypothetical protein